MTYYTTQPRPPRLKISEAIQPAPKPNLKMTEAQMGKAMAALQKANGVEAKLPPSISDVSKLSQRNAMVRDAVEKLGQPSLLEIQAELGISKSSAHTWVPDAVKAGVIVAIGHCNNRTYAAVSKAERVGQSADMGLTPQEEDEAVLNRIADLQRNLSQATLSAIGRPFETPCGNLKFAIGPVLARLEAAGLATSTSYRFQELTTAKLTPAGWDAVGDKPIWIT